jgi:hypothetical protein
LPLGWIDRVYKVRQPKPGVISPTTQNTGEWWTQLSVNGSSVGAVRKISLSPTSSGDNLNLLAVRYVARHLRRADELVQQRQRLIPGL